MVAPVVGLAAFVLPLYTQYFNLAELFNGNLFVWAHRDPATGASEFLSKTVPATWSVMCALLWVAIGIALSFYLHAMRPDALTRATHSFGGEVD